jgi:hypothetical protein
MAKETEEIIETYKTVDLDRNIRMGLKRKYSNSRSVRKAADIIRSATSAIH